MTANQSNLTPEQRLDAMVIEWGERHDVDPDFSPIPLEAVALDLLKRLDAAEARVKDLLTALEKSPKHWRKCKFTQDSRLPCNCQWSSVRRAALNGHPVQVKQEEDSRD